MQDVAIGKPFEKLRACRAVGDLPAGEHECDGRHWASVSAWIFVVRPPRERPMAWFFSPFSARCRAMRFDRGTVDQNLRRRAAGLSERMEQLDPHAFLRPADKAVVERLPRPVLGRRIDPATARFQHMDDAADHPPVVNARLAARVGRQMRRDLRKLLVRQPELIPIHRRFLSEAVNHKPCSCQHFYGSGP